MVVLGLTVGFFWIRAERQDAVAQKFEADKQKLEANTQKGIAEGALREQTRLAFDASYANAITLEKSGDAERIVKTLEPYLSTSELKDHVNLAAAKKLYEEAQGHVTLNAEARKKFLASEKNVEIYVGNGATMEWVLIPAGQFTMGSPKEEKHHDKGEQEHPVMISKPFYMGKYTVTQAQYESVVGKNPSVFDGNKNPVENVTWFDAVKFCQKLNEALKARLGIYFAFQLPTEAQWEYACRAGTKTRFNFGDADSDLDSVAWYSHNGGNKTHPVGEKKPNAFGLYDMHGNVWQWCRDARISNYEDLSKTDPFVGEIAPDETTEIRVLRGGSFSDSASYCRAAFRHGDTPGTRLNFVGFRVVLSLDSDIRLVSETQIESRPPVYGGHVDAVLRLHFFKKPPFRFNRIEDIAVFAVHIRPN